MHVILLPNTFRGKLSPHEHTSIIRAKGAHSYSSLSLAGELGELGFTNTPPPCIIWRNMQVCVRHAEHKFQVCELCVRHAEHAEYVWGTQSTQSMCEARRVCVRHAEHAQHKYQVGEHVVCRVLTKSIALTPYCRKGWFCKVYLISTYLLPRSYNCNSTLMLAS